MAKRLTSTAGLSNTEILEEIRDVHYGLMRADIKDWLSMGTRTASKNYLERVAGTNSRVTMQAIKFLSTQHTK